MDLPQGRRNSARRRPWTWIVTLPWVSKLPEFVLAHPHNCMNQLLKIYLSIYTYTSYWFSFPGESKWYRFQIEGSTLCFEAQVELRMPGAQTERSRPILIPSYEINKIRGSNAQDGDCNYQYCIIGTSLVVQWLRIRLPVQGTQVRSLVGELRSHVPRGN